MLHLRVIGGSGPKRLLLEEMIEREPLAAFESAESQPRSSRKPPKAQQNQQNQRESMRADAHSRIIFTSGAQGIAAASELLLHRRCR